MASPVPARPGDEIGQIDTPALVVDLDALEANIAAMAASTAAAGIALRPHGKTHKSVAIAKRQLAAGAAGLCCQKVSEAEALLPSGVADMLVSNHVVGTAKLQRLAALAAQVRTTTLTSDADHARLLSAAAAAAGVTFEILIEADAGDARMGLLDGSLLPDLALAVSDLPGLKLRGLQVYNGPFQHLRPQAARAQAAETAAARARAARETLLERGLCCDLLTGGGTGTFAEDIYAGVLNELQPGSYVFMDTDYGRNLDREGAPYRPFRQSLFVLTRVLRVPAPGVAYVDAGVKALNLDCGMPDVHEWPNLAYVRASDEQGRVEGEVLELGEELFLVPSHCDPTVNQYDWMVAVRGGRVEEVWPVDARGCVL